MNKGLAKDGKTLDALLAETDFKEATRRFYEEAWVPSKPDRYPPPGTEVEYRDGFFTEELTTVPGVIKKHYLEDGREVSTVIIVGKGSTFVNAKYDPELRRGGTWRLKKEETK